MVAAMPALDHQQQVQQVAHGLPLVPAVLVVQVETGQDGPLEEWILVEDCFSEDAEAEHVGGEAACTLAAV